MTAPRRGRGRPAGGDTARTRQVIVDAARRQFAERGFRGVSLRSIAGEAGVDASLISHHFGDKGQLLLATMELPFNPLERIGVVLEGPLDTLGERIIGTFCQSWDPHRDVLRTLIRSTFDGALENAPVLSLAREVIVERVAGRLDGDDAPVRAVLVVSQIAGLAVMRYVARVEPLASASIDDVVAAYAPAVQSVVTPG